VLSAAELDLLAARFDLGPGPVLTGERARGMQGEIWRLRTGAGDWAVKELFRVAPPASGPAHPWYTDPVGEVAWVDLLGRLEGAGNPLADALAAGHDDRLALERLLAPPTGLRLLHERNSA